jgi:DNA polymerase-3 subunit delta'
MEKLHRWNREKATRLAKDREHLPHALLLAGQKGIGKNVFAEWLAQFMLCAQPINGTQPCGQCHSCTLFVAGSHPDLHVVQPEAVYKSSVGLLAQYALRYRPEDKSRDSKDSTVIRIDQIRALIGNSQTRPQIADRKIIVLCPADTMNTNAANSLLKLLEEPPPDSFLLLIADRPSRLPATIRSRCTRLDFRVPDTASAHTWLESCGLTPAEAKLLLALAGGAPLEAQRYAEIGFLAQRTTLHDDLEKLATGQGDPLASAARWKALGADRCLHWLQGWIADLVAVSLRIGPEYLRNPDLHARLQALEKRLHLNQLFRFSVSIARNRNLLGSSVDEQLILEDTLISWAEKR